MGAKRNSSGFTGKKTYHTGKKYKEKKMPSINKIKKQFKKNDRSDMIFSFMEQAPPEDDDDGYDTDDEVELWTELLEKVNKALDIYAPFLEVSEKIEDDNERN